jgi:BMFP domain-containing protein YqiC
MPRFLPVLRLAFAALLRYQCGMNKQTIDQLARKLAGAVPKGLRSAGAEFEENFRAVLKSGLARMDLVTREEFAVQEAVLRRTREKLDVLEARLQALSDKPNDKPGSGKARRSPRKKKPGS